MADKKKDAKKAAKKAVESASEDTHLLVLVDESGSMSGKEEAVVSGVNEFLGRFKESEGKVRATVGWFDSAGFGVNEPRTRFKIKTKNVKKVDPLDASDYRPRGMTPLNDAIIDTINLADKEQKKGEGVFIVILTDGIENASETSAEDVAKAIKKREKDGWAFLYLGANQNADKVAANIGLAKKGQALTFNASKLGTSNALRSAHGHAMAYRRGGQSDYLASAAVTHDHTGGVLKDEEEVNASVLNPVGSSAK